MSEPTLTEDDGTDSVAALAGWVDDRLREASNDIKMPTGGAKAAGERLRCQIADDAYEDFREALHESQRLEIEETDNEESLKRFFNSCEDYMRVTILEMSIDCTASFHNTDRAVEGVKDLSEEASEHFDAWRFGIAWDLASWLLKNSSEDLSSNSNDSDEPVDESDSEDGEEEESSSAGSDGSDGSSSSEEEEGDEDEKENAKGLLPEKKKQKAG